MTHSDLTKRLISASGGKILLSKKEISQALGIGINQVTDLMEGFPYFDSGKAHRYSVDDVADAILQGRKNK